MAGVVAEYVAERSGESVYEARATRIEELTAERARLVAVQKAAEDGELASSHIPSDIHKYYGRGNQIKATLQELEHRQDEYRQSAYDFEMGEVRDTARADLRGRLEEVKPETLAQLQDVAQWERRWIRTLANDVKDSAIPRWLSNDDYVHAYRQGGHSELAKWYWEQKREHGLGKENGREMALDIFVPTLQFVTEQRTRFEQELKRAVDMLPLEGGPNAEVYATAATNHYRGRATEWNSWCAAIVEHNPALGKDLPPALQVDEIQVRRRALEQEQSAAIER